MTISDHGFFTAIVWLEAKANAGQPEHSTTSLLARIFTPPRCQSCIQSTDKHRSLPLFPNHFVIYKFPTLVDAEVIRSPYLIGLRPRLY